MGAKPFDTNAVALQRSYYKRTAHEYDRQHLGNEREHDIACLFISAFSRLLGATSLLDVGCGTGRALGILRAHNPELVVHGIDPVGAMLDEARAKFGVNGLICGDGMKLPFNDHSYDVVMETGVLHHVGEPGRVVREMMRVARKAVFISDHNIFGQGGIVACCLRWTLYKAKLWRVLKLAQNRGREYYISEDDGVAYSYSAYFQYRMLETWASRLVVIPMSQGAAGDLRPLSPMFGAAEVLLCAFKCDVSTFGHK